MIETQPLTVLGDLKPEYARILTPEALAFVAKLAEQFESERQALLQHRQVRWAELKKGKPPDFLPETEHVRQGDWRVAPAPADLDDRRVEITGPVERKMMINALNSGARVFMADFEDSCSPTWDNILQGQLNLMDAVRRTIAFTSPDGKPYTLGDRSATLVVRPRGWHLVERHVQINGESVSASLFDFGLYFFHNAQELLQRGSGPYFYLPKLEGHLEARLWNSVFELAQDLLGIPRGSIRATVLIETILAVFEMDEILYELRDHAAGLNAGRWDYIFSIIKKLGDRPAYLLPDRAEVTMGAPFMQAYTRLLVRTCHRRGAHAMGGMAAFVPSRKDPEVNARALAKVREDKEREVQGGFDGTWVAHPDLVSVATGIFDAALGDRPHQKGHPGLLDPVGARELLDVRIPGASITEEGVRNNVNVALQYLAWWLSGTGAVAIHSLMEDAATAEISRAQLWQWIRHGVTLRDGRPVTSELYLSIRDEERERLAGLNGLEQAVRLLDHLVLSESFVEFLTLPAYELLEAPSEAA